MKKLMEENYDFFLSQLPELLKDKNNIGNFVLIENKKIVGIYNNLYEAVDTAREEKKFKPETFNIQLIEEPKKFRCTRLHGI